MLDIIECTNMHILRVGDKDKRNNKVEGIFNETMAENFPNLMKYIYLHIQKVQEAPSRTNTKRFIADTSQ